MPQDPQDTAPESGLAKLAAGLRAAAAAAPAIPPPPEPGLPEALEAAKRDLVLEAIDGESCHELAAQAYAVEVLERLVYPLGRPIPAPEPAPYGGVVDAAVELAAAVKSSGLEAGHFVGTFDVLLGPIEKLGEELEREGLVP